MRSSFTLYSSYETHSIGDRRKIKGRLIVASKSLLFDPDDWRHPVLRLAYRDTALVQAVPTSSQRGNGSGDGNGNGNAASVWCWTQSV